MISLRIIRTRHFNNVPLNSSNFISLSSISRRPFSLPAESAHNADEKPRSFTEPLRGFSRRVILFGQENAAETHSAVPENENAESNLDRLRNLEEQVRHLNKEKRETAKKLQSLSEESDSAVAPKKEKKRSLSELFAKGKSTLTISESKSVSKPAPESESASELFASEKKGQSKLNSKSKSVSKPAALSISVSELFASERKGQSKSNSKSKSVSKPAAQSKSVLELFARSELFASERKGQSNSKSKSVSKLESESESASELVANEKKGKSKPSSKSKPVSKAKTALVNQTVCGMEDPMVHRELSSDMKMFAEHLYVKGYLKNATFLPQNKFDLSRFEVSCAREFLKFLAKKFGEDHPDIARLLSTGDLKKIALFGCPNVGKRTVFAAKHMRKFFKIDEHTVCQACTLKDMCKHANKISTDQSTNLHLPRVMKVLIMYALESVPEKLVVPEEVKNSVSRLLKEIVSLSQEKS